MSKDIILTVDYHDENCVIRRRDEATGEESVQTVATTTAALEEVVQAALKLTKRRRGQVVWIQESTTGWARVQALLGERVKFLLANVVQMPLPPKAVRRKTDRLDTARLQREYLNGQLPLAHQPPAWWRQVRRLVGLRESLVNRRTALRNWINRYLAHETWESRANLWSGKGQACLRQVATTLARLRRADRGAEARRAGSTGGATVVGRGTTARGLSRLAGRPADRRRARNRRDCGGIDCARGLVRSSVLAMPSS